MKNTLNSNHINQSTKSHSKYFCTATKVQWRILMHEIHSIHVYLKLFLDWQMFEKSAFINKSLNCDMYCILIILAVIYIRKFCRWKSNQSCRHRRHSWRRRDEGTSSRLWENTIWGMTSGAEHLPVKTVNKRRKTAASSRNQSQDRG